MNPPSGSQPQEGDSRRFALAAADDVMGWTRARARMVSPGDAALMR